MARYELVLIYEASSDRQAHKAADAAWNALEGTRGCAMDWGMARERLATGATLYVSWDEWDQETTAGFSLYEGEND